jgi:hypothetical protein
MVGTTEVYDDILASESFSSYLQPTQHGPESLLAKMVQKYEMRASRLANWMEANILEGLAVFTFPAAHHRRPRPWPAHADEAKAEPMSSP